MVRSDSLVDIIEIWGEVLGPASQAREELLFLFLILTLHGFQILGSHRSTSIILVWWTENAFNMGLRASVLPSLRGVVSPVNRLIEISFYSWWWLCHCSLINIIYFFSVRLAIRACRLICIRGSCRMTKSVSRWWEAFLGPNNLSGHRNVTDTRWCRKWMSDRGLQ